MANLSSVLSELCAFSNASSLDSTQLNCQPEKGGGSSSSLDQVKVVVLSVIIVLTVLGNASVVLPILMRKGKVSRMYFFILHLSIADMITAFFTLVPELVWTFTFPRFFGNAILCKLVKYGQVVGPYLSSYTLAMTAVDRYQAICDPLSHCRWSLQRSYVMLALAWLVSLIFSLPQMLVYSGKIDGYCTPDWPVFWNAKSYGTFYSLANFFVPLVILIFCYGKMCDALWTNFKHKKEQQLKHAAATLDDDRVSVTRAPRCQWMRNVSLWTRSKRSVANDLSMVADGGHNEEKRELSKKEMAVEEPQPDLGLPDPQTLLLDADPKPTAASDPQLLRSTEKPSSRSQNNIDVIAVDEVNDVEVAANRNDDQHKVNNTRQQRSGEEKRRRRRRDGGGQPERCYLRTHGTTTISNAKIKTVKLTVVVVLGYIVCSAPYVCVHLYTVWGHPTSELLRNIKWLFWLFTLNSCLNPWIYMSFNPELMQTLCPCCCRRRGVRGGQRTLATRATLRTRFITTPVAYSETSVNNVACRRTKRSEAIELRVINGRKDRDANHLASTHHHLQ